ncbi:MAG: ABC transporter permease [Thermoanaerobaculia bacterium]|nr:ABC transporter permease [Thermoanaerobaculia bacterium]
MLRRLISALAPFGAILLLLAAWHLAVVSNPGTLIPSPFRVAAGINELFHRGLLIKYIVASLFRVTWGYALAVLIAVPAGIVLGMSSRLEASFNPMIQIARPISALAWIPIAILWFGVGDLSAIFLIFLASFFPMLVTAINAVHNIDPIYLDAGRNFGLAGRELVVRIVFPAAVPQLIAGLRITLGVSGLVVVAAEMIAVTSGLGFLIVDSRNAGDRYDLVIGGMVMIGVIGLLLDRLIRQLERLDSVKWGYSGQ